jgi:hypothetical protein
MIADAQPMCPIADFVVAVRAALARTECRDLQRATPTTRHAPEVLDCLIVFALVRGKVERALEHGVRRFVQPHVLWAVGVQVDVALGFAGRAAGPKETTHSQIAERLTEPACLLAGARAVWRVRVVRIHGDTVCMSSAARHRTRATIERSSHIRGRPRSFADIRGHALTSNARS